MTRWIIIAAIVAAAGVGILVWLGSRQSLPTGAPSGSVVVGRGEGFVMVRHPDGAIERYVDGV